MATEVKILDCVVNFHRALPDGDKEYTLKSMEPKYTFPKESRAGDDVIE